MLQGILNEPGALTRLLAERGWGRVSGRGGVGHEDNWLNGNAHQGCFDRPLDVVRPTPSP